MAQYAHRLRRALAATSSLLNRRGSTPSLLNRRGSTPSLTPLNQLQSLISNPTPCRLFTSTRTTLSARFGSSPSNRNDGDEIGPDTILFEGCDYNHWLIVVDFPKDPKPTNDEMLKFYEDTATKIFGSLEEAKKKIYCCSTTTYTGFQVECSEEISEKFKDLPGVIFVLPDSFIDPVNKQYGGDKYINGQIIPRPPPVQYGRSGPNREFRSRPSNRGPMDGANSNYGPPVTPQQNYGSPPPPQRNFEGGNRNYGPPVTPQQNFSGPPPPQQNMEGAYRNYGPPGAPQQNFGTPPPPQQNFGPSPPRPQQSFGPSPPQRNYGPPNPPSNFPQNQNYGPPPPQNYGPPQQGYGQPGLGERRGPLPPNNAPVGLDNSQGVGKDQMHYSQGERGNFNPQGQSNFGQGNQGSYGTENRGFSGGYDRQASPATQGQENGAPYSQYNQRR